MSGERILELLEARPFKPFTLILGFEMDSQIDDPKLAILHEDGQTLIVHNHRAASVDRWETWIDLKLVSAVMVKKSTKDRD